MKRIIIFLSLTFFIFSSVIAQSQKFEKRFTDTKANGYSIEQLSTGNYVVVGQKEVIDIESELAYCLNSQGEILWELETFENSSLKVIKETEGGLIVGGSSEEFNIVLRKYTLSGDLIWDNSFDISTLSYEGSAGLIDLEVDTEGNLHLLISYSPNSIPPHPIIVKLSPEGDIIWHFALPTSDENYYLMSSFTLAQDGGYLIDGFEENYAVIKKVSNTGEISWTYLNNATNTPNILNDDRSIIELTNGNIIKIYSTPITSSFYQNHALLINGEGGFISNINLNSSSSQERSESVCQINDNHFALTGLINGQMSILKFNLEGDIIWSNTFGGSYLSFGRSIKHTSDGGFIIAGTILFPNLNTSGVTGFLHVVKTDSLGNVRSSFINGNIAYDLSENCEFDVSDLGLNNWVIKIENDTSEYYTLSDTLGNYFLTVDSLSQYNVNITPPNEYWGFCENSISIESLGDYDTLNLDFQSVSIIECPVSS